MSVIKMKENVFQILDTRFHISGSERWLSYFSRFSDSYESKVCIRHNRIIKIIINEMTNLNLDLDLDLDWSYFHKSSNYDHWNIKGYRYNSFFIIPKYGLKFHFKNETLTLYANEKSTIRGAELLFHAARNIALYLRSEPFGIAVHASAVNSPNGAILFAGNKGSGKSTQFLEALDVAGVLPFANDRVFFSSKNHIYSWPSYLSYCEGTITDYPKVKMAFNTYENCNNENGLKKWGVDYDHSYVQNKKRIIPQDYLTNIYNFKYSISSKLKAIIFSNFNLEYEFSFSFKLINNDSFELKNNLKKVIFNDIDEDIPCWHEQILKNSNYDIDKLIDFIKINKVKIYIIDANPSTFKPKFRLFISDIINIK
ncbi:hypothetical protein [Bartonella tamiae]|uniref:HPr kinase/phosphorylase C-terminal domain-containing protein n=1 Tax=Bartonella tamiae Th239 TaxID=1094558 RepID=J0ZQX2_9HYPH|nr:hypothetical protein [Bartonella tamiae]EJF91078.1 hypothetical protein ME5_00410 [Bartonella tamiae Th239]EJF93257.1 hypothetical protein MEG_01471 [Bartonella tamiae Th307]